MNRENFIKAGTLGLVGLWSASSYSTPLVPAEKTPIKISTIKEFVTVGHGNLDKVKEMLAETPQLIYARHDWGNGDFEEAIEGAGHVGNKEIANFLIEKGARVNLFVLAMLGKTQLVKPVLEEFPHLVNSYGAHGFTLLHHANHGGENAKELQDYLLEKGLSKTNIYR